MTEVLKLKLLKHTPKIFQMIWYNYDSLFGHTTECDKSGVGFSDYVENIRITLVMLNLINFLYVS